MLAIGQELNWRAVGDPSPGWMGQVRRRSSLLGKYWGFLSFCSSVMGFRVQMSLTRPVPCLWLPNSCVCLDPQAGPYGYDLVSSEGWTYSEGEGIG